MKKIFHILLLLFLMIFLLINFFTSCDLFNPVTNSGNGNGDDGDDGDDGNGSKIVFVRETGVDGDGDSYTNIFTMDIDGSNVQPITTGNNYYNNPHFSPDGTKIVFVAAIPTDDDDDEIMIMDSNGANITQLTNNIVGDWNPAF